MLTSRKAGRRMRNVSIDRRVEDSKDYLLEELEEFLRMPSVSAQGGDEGSFRGCAEWVRAKLEEVGAEAQLMETEGHPVVFAEMGGAGDGDRTLLSYGHYDVQPPEPLELWKSDPFEPEVRDGVLFARGVADDKGDVMARIQALRVYQEEHGPLPFRLKFLIEGEEEVGSTNLAPFVRRNKELLEAALQESWGVTHFDRDLTGKEALKEYLLRPTANIAGIQSGYTGPGAKTIVPSEAFVKMDFRLVAGQSPGAVLELLREHLYRRGCSDIEVVDLHGVEAAKTPVDSPVVRTAVETWEELGAKEAVVHPTIGGSGPTSLIATELVIPTVMTGAIVNPESRIHAPNESARLDDYVESISYFTRFFERFAA